MRIVLYGYGKMGKDIEQAAQQRGHAVVLRVNGSNAGAAPIGADLAIEFSRPEQAIANIDLCLKHGVPVVVGTTGWYDRMNDVRTMVSGTRGSLLWASNFSIGVNLFFRVNRLLAGLMDARPEYHTHIDEIHHVHKLDAPSGTAISLARDIDLKTQRYSGWKLNGQGQAQVMPNGPAPAPAPIPILSER